MAPDAGQVFHQQSVNHPRLNQILELIKLRTIQRVPAYVVILKYMEERHIPLASESVQHPALGINAPLLPSSSRDTRA